MNLCVFIKVLAQFLYISTQLLSSPTIQAGNGYYNPTEIWWLLRVDRAYQLSADACSQSSFQRSGRSPSSHTRHIDFNNG